jgi:peptidoglycan/LPS O-acetylase OafA/YrhL
MSGAPADPKGDLPALTGIRGLAAWFVVLYHVRLGIAPWLPAPVNGLLAKGYLAVDLFFMLSGFVLWLNYSKRMREEGWKAVPAYIGRRIARIWPLHLVILGATAAFAAVLAAHGKLNPDHYPWSELPLHVLLVHNWGFTDQLTWNDPSWSISGELAAYLLFPLVAMRVDWRRVPALVAVAALAALPLILAGIMALGEATILDRDIPRFGLLRALTGFTMGTILCGLWLRWRGRAPLLMPVALAAGASALVLRLAGVWPETLAIPYFLAALLFALALKAESARNPLGWRPLHYLGGISYSTYLVHFLLYILFKLVFVEQPGRMSPLLLGLFLLLTLLSSVGLYHGVERPAQRALNRAFARRREPPRVFSAAE